VNILLTGGAGYIGSHTGVVLSQAGHQVVLLDNFCNSRRSVLGQLQKILGNVLPCIDGDVRHTALVTKALHDYKNNAVIHFAGLKAVGESVKNPIEYYANNVQGSISLLQAMQKVAVKTLIFSSSATVYGESQYLPYDENHPTKPMNPYGQTKLQAEEILRDLSVSDPEWRIVSLRYFNPAGAHESALIGENPNGVPNNLMPYVLKVASGTLPHLNIFGDDYETRDGTGERDYIHVMDLAEGHMASLDFLKDHIGMEVINLGTGKSISVLELIYAFEKISGKVLKKIFTQKRNGDLAAYYAQADKARNLLKWKSCRNLETMCRSAWFFTQNKQDSEKN
jgi:UDP-glucose 4-epimerase